MTLYGIGLGPGDPELITVRGKRALEEATVVYTPGRLAKSVVREYVPADRVAELAVPMTRDRDRLQDAWLTAAHEIGPRAQASAVAFVTLGDPSVYSTFGYLRAAIRQQYPDTTIDVIPGVSAVTAFAAALGVDIETGAGLSLREADNGRSPTGPDRMILFKITDAPATHDGLAAAGYDVVYGRRLFMEDGQTTITRDPDTVANRDYYTLAYAEKEDLEPGLISQLFDETTGPNREGRS